MVVDTRRWSALVGLLVGVCLVAIGVGMVPHLVKDRLGPGAVAAVTAVAAGVLLVVRGIRGTVGRPAGRAALAAGSVLGLVVAISVISPAVAATQAPSTSLRATPSDVGLRSESVSLAASDGTQLAGWYVPSRSGAAVVLRHGAGSTRSAVLHHAEVLADAGLGVLMMDARGHGDSHGTSMEFGWWGEEDVSAGVEFLSDRDEVDPGRIGVVGLSMGAEEAIGAAAADRRIRAVVAEGATARTAADKAWLSEVHGWRGSVQEWIERAQYGLTRLLTDAPAPRPLQQAVRDAAGTEFLLVAAGEVADEADAARHVAAGAPDRVGVWVVEGAGHTDALATDPREWRRRVVGFLDQALAPTG